MPKNAYSYNPLTGVYTGPVVARESPLDQELGKTVYLIPAHATEVAPPQPLADHNILWDGSQWIQKKIDKITKTVTQEIYQEWLENDLFKAFPDITIKIEGDVASKASRSITFHGIPDTPANNTTLDAVLAAHVLPNTKIEQLGPIQLAIVQTLCSELQKINENFPDFATFKEKVNTLLAQPKE